MRLSAMRAPVLSSIEEQQARLRGDGDLGVIAGGFESLAAFGERGVELVGALDGRAQHGRAEAMEVAAGGVDDEKALGGEDLRVEIGESLREGAAGLVGGGEGIGGFGGAEQLGGALDKRRDGVVEARCGRRAARIRELFRR